MLSPETLLKERYRILHKIGDGGFGYVYKAMDEVFGCSVAIKETKEEVANRGQLRKAFEREAKLLRNLKHDSLPRVTDYFFQDQAQFLVMDFIEGEDLAARLRKRLQQHQSPFTCQELLPWADKILAALEYLHSRPEPIIHRDIKPANIKLTDDGGIYLLDFGLAKGVFGQMSTIIEGQPASIVPGFTREYAPLEQLQDTGTEPQSDIYAFGATLYHLLTGQLPISASLRDEALQRGEGDPLRPVHKLNSTVSPAVSQVISESLAVRWWDRTSSAKEMRVALSRACENPVAARPHPATQSDSKSVTPDSEEEISTLPLLSLHERTAPDNIEKPVPVEIPARQHRFHRSWLIAGLSLVFLASLVVVLRFAFPHWFNPAVQNKSEAQAAPPSKSLKPPVAATPTDLKLTQTLEGHTDIVWSVAFSPRGDLAASASKDKTIILWDTATWNPKFPHPLTGHEGEVYSIAFSPDGETLASGSNDKTIKLWKTQTGELLRTFNGHTKPVLRLAFSPDGKFLASFSGDEKGGDKEIRLWDVNSGLSWTLKGQENKGHDNAVSAIAFSPDGSILASAGYDNKLLLWDLEGEGQSTVLQVYDQPLKALAFSADGRYLACGSDDKTIKLWLYQPQAQRWEPLAPLESHKDSITSIAFSPDNKTLVSASKDKTIRLWDVTSRRAPNSLSTNQGGLQTIQRSVAFSPDGQTLLTGGEDNTVKVWR
jgi:eukaryotic-like serine/threonine-protein kinase